MTEQQKIQALLDVIEEHGFQYSADEEDGELCGYELESWTDGGVDMPVYLDCRAHNYADGLTAENLADQVRQAYLSFDVDEEIDLHREMKDYRAAFSIHRSVEDFEGYEQTLKDLSEAVTNKMAELYDLDSCYEIGVMDCDHGVPRQVLKSEYMMRCHLYFDGIKDGKIVNQTHIDHDRLAMEQWYAGWDAEHIRLTDEELKANGFFENTLSMEENDAE